MGAVFLGVIGSLQDCNATLDSFVFSAIKNGVQIHFISLSRLF